MKIKFFILCLYLLSYSADPLGKIYTRYKNAETIEFYKKADNSLEIMSVSEFNSLPDEIKNQYKNYGDYVSQERLKINAVKRAMRDKLNQNINILSNSDKFSPDEKLQYTTEIQTEIDNIKDLK